VGSYALDNSNFTPKETWGGSSRLDWAVQTPIDRDPDVIRRNIWWAADLAYKQAVEDLKRKKTVLTNRSVPPVADDLARAPVVDVGPQEAPQILPSIDTVKQQARHLSALLVKNRNLRESSVGIGAAISERWLVNSEGTRFHVLENTAQVGAAASAQADDGVIVGDSYEVYALSFDKLPALAQLESGVAALGKRVEAMREAPLLEDFVGPVLFEGEAAAELCTRVLPPSFSSWRAPIAEDAGSEMSQGYSDRSKRESLRRKIGRRVMATGFNVVDDPLLKEFEGTPLMGTLQVDSEGVKPERVELVKKGILKTLLTTRTPDKKLPESNGHAVVYGSGARRSEANFQAGATTLIISYENGLDDAALRARLLQTIKDQDSEYGLIIRKIGNESSPQYGSNRADTDEGFIRDPLLAYCVYPDGNEKLVRIVALKGMNFDAFKDVLAAGSKAYVHNAPGPGAYVSVICPSILFEEGVVIKPERDVAKPPLLPSPLLEISDAQ
jgi:hypothetical protein